MLVAVDPPEDLSSPVALAQGLTPVPHRPATFDLALSDRKLTFKPFYSVKAETYTTYLRRKSGTSGK